MRIMFPVLLMLGAAPMAGQPASERLFLEVPMLLDAPGQQQMIRAWYDGEHFFVDAAMLLDRLGFTVTVVESRLTALDVARTIVVDFDLRQQLAPQKQALGDEVLHADGRFLLSMAGLGHLFGSDIHFDADRLVLRVSTAAQRFDARALHRRRPLWSEAPGPLQFGRQRTLWGGVMMNWQLHRQPGYVQAGVSVTGSLLAGTLRGYVGTGRQSLTYLYDRPRSMRLTRLEFGRFADGVRGIRLSNRPLAQRQLQRMEELTGQTEPHALVEAHVGGHVMDQVLADGQGRYRLRTPVWYGTQVVELRTRPLGGQLERLARRYYLADPELVESGRWYYDVKVGHLRYGSALIGDLQYGLARALTVTAAVGRQSTYSWLETGGIWSPLSYLTVRTSARWPARQFAAGFRAWTRTVSLDGNWYARDQGGGGLQLNAGGLFGPVSVNLDAYAHRHPPYWESQLITPSLWLSANGGLTLRALWHLERSGVHKTQRRDYWQVGAGAPIKGAHARLSLSGRDTRWILGLEGFLVVGGWSVQVTTRVDARSGRIEGGLTLQANLPFASMAARALRRDSRLVHTQSFYGQVAVDRHLEFGRDVHQQSAAKLIIFRDINGNGRQEDGEPVLPHIRAQLYHANWTRDPDGTLYAGHLEPFSVYQVRLLEDSVRDPRLQPATGYAFSFVADPGRTKRLLVPMQPRLQVPGRILNADRPPSRMRVHATGGSSVPVYRDGGFTLLLTSGSHEIIVTDVLTKESLGQWQMMITADTSDLNLTLNRP
ncbi:MAG: hypothetical protein OXI38_13670 [Bacteroidota bacterium]|nr:hypothetical protein [Bacteroidota bacterium]